MTQVNRSGTIVENTALPFERSMDFMKTGAKRPSSSIEYPWIMRFPTSFRSKVISISTGSEKALIAPASIRRNALLLTPLFRRSVPVSLINLIFTSLASASGGTTTRDRSRLRKPVARPRNSPGRAAKMHQHVSGSQAQQSGRYQTLPTERLCRSGEATRLLPSS